MVSPTEEKTVHVEEAAVEKLLTYLDESIPDEEVPETTVVAETLPKSGEEDEDLEAPPKTVHVEEAAVEKLLTHLDESVPEEQFPETTDEDFIETPPKSGEEDEDLDASPKTREYKINFKLIGEDILQFYHQILHIFARRISSFPIRWKMSCLEIFTSGYLHLSIAPLVFPEEINKLLFK